MIQNNRIKLIYQITILVFSLVLQYTAVRHVSLLGVRPNLPLVAIIAIGIASGPEPAALAGFILGLYQDSVSGKILGMYALFYLYVGVIAGLLSKRNSMKSLPASIVMTYVLSAVTEVSIYLFGYVIPILRSGHTPNASFFYALGRIIPIASLMNAVLAIFYYLLFKSRKKKETEQSYHVV